ncbi:HNH endonuclease [Paenibacillus pabuli]|uniref:HNH endonuclease n=1 Tax=Paenibacillus pabuli TaxID=1472 RepID=UPI00345795D9
MNICIICNETEATSVEHIIPHALGGTLTTKSCCKPCNDLLGSKIDSLLTNSEELKMVRFLLKIRGKNGVPNPFSKLLDGPYPGIKGYLKFNHEGTYEGFQVLTKPIVNTEERLVIIGESRNKLLQAINKIIKKNNQAEFTIEDLEKNLGPSIQIGNPQINIGVNKEMSESFADRVYLAILKIAYEASLHLLGQEYKSDTTGNDIRLVLKEVIYGKTNIFRPTRMNFYNLNWENPKRYHSIDFKYESNNLFCTINLLNFLVVKVLVSKGAQKYSLSESSIELTF